MKKLGTNFSGAKPQDLLASVVLVFEALYFIIATAIITGFGMLYAQGDLAGQGLLGTASLPLIAVGAFAIWSLALLHVLPPVKPMGTARARQGTCEGNTKVVAQIGFILVVLTHAVYGLLLIGQGKGVLGTGVLVLGSLLLGCCVSQFRAQAKIRHAGRPKLAQGESPA